MADASIVQSAFLAGAIAAGATMLGTLPALFAKSLSPRVQDTMLGFGAGIMLAAASFSLVLPAPACARPSSRASAPAPFVACSHWSPWHSSTG